MERKGRWLERMREGMDLSGATLPGVPVVEIYGRNRLLIECHGGVTCYGMDKICVRVKFGQICIEGTGLQLCKMSREQLVVCGTIHGIRLEKEGC